MGKTACRRRHGSIAPSVSPPLTAALTSIQDMTSALSLMAAVAALMLVGNVDANARKYLVETKDDRKVEKKVLPKFGEIVGEVGKELDNPTISKIGEGISKVATLV